MPPKEQAERMLCLRRFAADLDIDPWAGRTLVDSANLREVERLAHIPTELPPGSGVQIA